MPGTPRPVVDPRFGPAWTPILQSAQNAKQQTAALNSGSTQGNIPDQYGNTIQLSGSNLNQIVTIGASHGVSGVQVSTGIAAGTAGLAVQSGPAITTITLAQGSTAATVGTVTGASLAKGQVIGAANVSDPSTGTPTPAITPGTTIAAVSGTSVTLSQGAAESGTSLFCAAGRFLLQQDTGWLPLTLSGNVNPASGYAIPSARIQGDRVSLKGSFVANTSIPNGTAMATLPAAAAPAVLVTLGTVLYTGIVGSYTPAIMFITTVITLGLNITSGYEIFLDGVVFTID